jgi:hypothetical protein
MMTVYLSAAGTRNASNEKMNELIKQGRVVQTKPGAVLAYKRYLDEMPAISMGKLENYSLFKAHCGVLGSAFIFSISCAEVSSGESVN